MPKIGRSRSSSRRIVGTAYSPVAAGSPGPFERKTPSGFSARMSAALVVAGRAKTLAEGVAIGRDALDSGAAAARLKHLIAVSNS